VREFLFGIAEHWIRNGIDGWRLDVPGEIDDDEFWREFRRRVRAINSEAYIVGEIWHEAQRWLQGDQFDATMNYLITAAALGFFANEHLDMHAISQAGGLKDRVRPFHAHDFADEVDRVLSLYPREINFSQLNLLDSHDMPRFLTCVRGDKNSIKLAWLFIFTMHGAPCIYYGDEIGLDGGHDPECRKSFPWEEEKWDKDLLAYVKACIIMRKTHPALRYGEYHRGVAEDDIISYSRVYKNESLVVAFNVANEEKSFNLPLEKKPRILFGNPSFIIHEKTVQVTIPPRTGIVVK